MPQLRPYQVEPFEQVVSTTDDFLIDHPTGSGKTYLMTAIAAHLLNSNRRVLIATTQGHIQDSFTNRNYDHLGVGDQTISIPATRLQRAGEDGATIEQIETYLVSTPDFVLVCTHAALTRIKPPSAVNVCRGDVLIVDEAHHASAVGLSQFITAWRANGGRVLFFTATPSRGDDKPVRLPDMRVISRPLFQHMQEGYAPSVISHSITAVKTANDVSYSEFTGATPPPRELHASLVQHITTAWVEAGRPKLIVRVPAVRGGATELVNRTIAAFINLGARTLDVTGASTEDRQRIETALRHEREVDRFEDSTYDVIVGVSRVYEAMDWKWCSAFFSIGFPAAYSTAMQMLGRTTRLKPDDYPEPHRDVAMVRFFVPVSGDTSLRQASRYHAQRVLLACVQMADAQVGYTFTTISQLHKYVQVGLGSTSISVDDLVDAYPYIDPAVRAELYQYVAAAVAAHEASDLVPTNASIYMWIMRNHPTACGPVLQQLLVETSIGSSQETAQAVARAVALNHMGGLPLREAIVRAYESIEPNFLREAVTSSAIYANFAVQTLQLTGEQIERFSVDLMTVRPLTRDWVIDRLLATLGEWQFNDVDVALQFVLDAEVPGWPNESWRWIEQSIANNARQWLGPEQSLRAVLLAALSPTVEMLVHGFMTRQPTGVNDMYVMSRFIRLPDGDRHVGERILDQSTPSLTPFFRDWFSRLCDTPNRLVFCLAAYSFALFSRLAVHVSSRTSDDAGIAAAHRQLTRGVWLRFSVPEAIHVPTTPVSGSSCAANTMGAALHIPADLAYCGPVLSHFLTVEQQPPGSIMLSSLVDQAHSALNDNVDLVERSYICINIAGRIDGGVWKPYKKGIQGPTGISTPVALVIPFSWVTGIKIQAGYRNLPLSQNSMLKLLRDVFQDEALQPVPS